VTDNAIHAARRALLAAPDDPRALFILAALLLRAGDPEVRPLLPRLDRFERFSGGWLTIAEALLGRDQPTAALAALSRALRHLPEAPLSARQQAAAHVLHGRTLRELGRHEEARTAFEHALRLDPKTAEAHYRLALLHQDETRADAAERHYRAALALRPDLHEAAFNLGVLLADLNRADEALDAFAQAYRSRPDSFGRIAQALTSGRSGLLFLAPGRLRERLAAG
jgi:tetratricopeptide (TPR) repeat protein